MSEDPDVQRSFSYYLSDLLTRSVVEEEIEYVHGAGEKRKWSDDPGGCSVRTATDTPESASVPQHQISTNGY